ncbi:hypothetical protein [Schinkia azotoformans]|uniref:hypothetical protein n=1 Tax=Schinkia azotoformans TaxID=1454 RepID=UPI002DBF800C|nr:hypothetical protein [Schinkia azotoformans]MEC1780062.1 hypothetical protein [Schinkia azotoformans]MED4330859.1 hypothetical protein [Schinkia azotoformans]
MGELLNVAKGFLSVNNIEIDIKTDETIKEIANYNPITNVLSFNPVKITNGATNYSLNDSDYLILTLSHELGHYLDEKNKELTQRTNDLLSESHSPEIENELLRINKELEKNAWEIGRRFVPEELMNVYNQINLKNLEVTNINKLRLIYELKCNKEKEKLHLKIQELFKENKELRHRNIELLEENFELKFGKKMNIDKRTPL